MNWNEVDRGEEERDWHEREVGVVQLPGQHRLRCGLDEELPEQMVPDLLDNGVRVLIYAGDVDYICNWIGNKAWTMDLPWSGSSQFKNAGDNRAGRG